MLEEYKMKDQEKTIEEIRKNAKIEEDVYRLVTLIFEASFYYDSNNKLVMTESHSEVARKINESLEEYCKSIGIDKKHAMEIAKKSIRNNNELRFNPTQRKMAMDLLGIEDEDGQR